MLRLFHVADVHFGTLYEQFDPKMRTILREKKREAFMSMIQRAVEENIDLLVFSGDIFDKDAIDPSTKIFFQEAINKLQERGVSCYYIKGNHDANHRFSLQHVHILGDDYSLMEEDQYRVVGLSYNHTRDKRNITRMLKDLPKDKINILLFHGLLTHDEGALYQHLDPRDEKVKAFHYIACGHVHKPQGPIFNAYYTGAFFPQNKLDTGDHFYLDVLVSREELMVRKVKSTPFTIKRMGYELHATDGDFSTEHYRKLQSFIEGHIKNSYLHLELYGLLSTEEYHEALALKEMLIDHFKPYLSIENNLRVKPSYSKHSFLSETLDHLKEGLLQEAGEDFELKEDIIKHGSDYEKLLLEVFLEDSKWK